jgi:DNA-binding HxlR family transcriptional regulator
MVTNWSMVLKIQLVEDGKVLLEMSLERETWGKEALESELVGFESTLEEVAEMHDIFSNQMRTRMLCEMIRSSDRRFSEFMEILDANQKIVSENLRRMVKNGLVERIEKRPGEVHYVPTNLGFATTLAFRMMDRILDELE